jgi:hypothetical protein
MPHTPFLVAVTFRTVRRSVRALYTPFLAKPVTFRESRVTSSTLRFVVPSTQMPLPSAAQLLAALFALGLITTPWSMPRTVSPGVLIATLSR